MATLTAMLGVVDQQFSNRTRFGAWRRAVTEALDPGGGPSSLVSHAQACAGEIQMSSPLGQWMLALSEAIAEGVPLPSSALGPVRAQIGRGPFMQWAERITLAT